MSYLSHINVCLCCVWIRLHVITVYLLCAWELWQINSLALQFWYMSSALSLRVFAFDTSKSQCTYFVTTDSQVNMQLLIYNYHTVGCSGKEDVGISKVHIEFLKNYDPFFLSKKMGIPNSVYTFWSSQFVQVKLKPDLKWHSFLE